MKLELSENRILNLLWNLHDYVMDGDFDTDDNNTEASHLADFVSDRMGDLSIEYDIHAWIQKDNPTAYNQETVTEFYHTPFIHSMGEEINSNSMNYLYHSFISKMDTSMFYDSSTF